MPQDRVVLCMKWGTLYPASYVNALYSAVKKHLTPPFRFVCLTNEPEGLDPGIEHFPMPDLDLPEERYKRGAWPKLGIFSPKLFEEYGLHGRCLFIDLDMVILGSLDKMFERPEKFIAVGGGPNWGRGKSNTGLTLSSTLFAFNLGEQTEVLDKFMQDKDAAYKRFANEQQTIEGYTESWNHWPLGWVVSFKKHLRRPLLIDMFLKPYVPDNDVVAITFHGEPNPIDLVSDKRTHWFKFPRSVRTPVEWVREYWLEHGYTKVD